MKFLSICFFALFATLVRSEELLELVNTDGKSVKGYLRAKDDSSATIEINNKTFQIPLEKLSAASVDLIKKSEAHAATSKRFKLVVDVKKSGKTHRSASTRNVPSSEGGTTVEVSTSSYRIDDLDGIITISNGHNTLATAPVEVKSVLLLRNGSSILPVNPSSSSVPAIEPLKKEDLGIPPIKIRHSAKASGSNGYVPDAGNLARGKYCGYIAAIYQNGELLMVKSVPSTYERDHASAEKLLFVNSGFRRKAPLR